MNYRKVCIIVPAYNEELSITKVIQSIKKLSKKLKIVVINDGSSDNTFNVVKKLKVEQIILPFNLGIGGAVQTGLIYAKNNNFNIAIQIDADGQHDPQYLPTLLDNLEAADLIIGSRYIKKTNYKTPFMRLIGIRIFSQLILLTCGQKIYDATSGYRVFNNKAIDYFSKIYPQEFPEPLSIVSFLKNGYKIKEIAVESRKRIAGYSSVTFLYSIYLMLSISIAIILESYKNKDLKND